MSESSATASAGGKAVRRSELSVGLAGSAFAVTVWGMSSVVAKVIDMGALAISSYRFLLYAVVLGVYLSVRRTPITVKSLRASLWGGLALGLDVACFFTAVKLTTVANATIVNALQIVMVSLFSAKRYGERMSRRDIGYAAVAMVGVGFVASGSSGSQNWSLAGDLAAVGALFAWSAYFVLSREARGKVSTQQYTVCVAIYTGLLNLPLAVLFGQDLSWPTANSWMWLSVMAFGSGLGGHTVMNWSLTKVPLWLASVLTLFIPVVASAVAWVWFGEALSVVQIVAMLVVVAALGMVVRNQSRPRIGGVPAAESGPAAAGQAGGGD